MKMHHYISALWAAICLMAVTLSACADHDYQDQPGGGGSDEVTTVQISLNVVLPSMSKSRATYELGDTYENTVNMADNDFRLLLFTSDTKTLVCNFDPQTVSYQLSTMQSYKVCTISAEVDKELTTYRDLRLVMLANWGDYPTLTIGSTTIDDLVGYAAANGAVSTDATTTFAASNQLVASSTNYIPLYGVRECNNINWVADSRTWLGNLWLLRAVAKIEVRSANGIPPIESVELTRYNAQGTCAPRGVYSESDYVGGIDRYKPVNYVTLPGGVNDTQAKNYLMARADVDDDAFVVYVPEYQILSDYAKPQQPRADMPVLNVKFQGVDKVYQVEFKYYTEASASDNEAHKGDYFDIRRNFIYRYSLRLTDASLEWDVDVLPYTSVELKPNFGLLLAQISLNKYVSRLYIDLNGPTRSQEVLTAYNENNKPFAASNIVWRLSETITNHVCTIEENTDGTCTVKPIDKTTGRDIVEAVIRDKNGFEVIAECIVEVTERHLGLEKAFLGLIPYDVLPQYSSGSFRVNIVAERDANSKISWELLDDNDAPLPDDLSDLVTVTAEGDGGSFENGDFINEKNVTIHVNANALSKFGDAHLWVYYDGPDPEHLDDPTKRRTYSTYCDIDVSNVSMTVYPTVLNMTAGQESSVTARTAPIFSDYIPTLKFESLNENVVTVDSNGLVHAISQGTTKIKVTSPDDLLNWIEPEYVDVNVVPDNLVLVRYDGTHADYIELLKGEELQLKAMSHGIDVSSQTTWSIVEQSLDQNSTFVTVNNGVVKAVSAGTRTIKASYTVDGQTFTETCIVSVANQRKVKIDEFPKSVSKFASVPMHAYVYPDSRPYDQRHYDVTWTSSDPSIIAFDDKDDPSLAVAKSSGSATITATVVYGSETLTSEALQIHVFDPDEEEVETEVHLYIYDAGGKKVKEITTEYVYYPGYETGQGGWNDDTVNVGEEELFDIIKMPLGQTWTARIEITPPPVDNPAFTWKKTRRYEGHGDRINITPSPDGKSCQIYSRDDVGDIPSRYNEVHLEFSYEGKVYTRRFCVYTTNQ